MKVSTDTSHPSGVNYELTQEEFDAGYTVALVTGPIQGAVSLPDGTVYEVSPPHIAVRPEHLDALRLAIHKKHHAEGRFLDVPLPSE
jgi:hypothetical protein